MPDLAKMVQEDYKKWLRGGTLMPKKTQGEEIFDRWKNRNSFSSADMTNPEKWLLEALCAQATQQERTANALERIADSLEEEREVTLVPKSYPL